MLSRFSPYRGNRRIQSRRGFTLVEMLVSIVAGLIILAAFVAITLNVNTMMVMVGNYNDLDKYSRNTLDLMSRDIRNAAGVGNTSSATSLTLTNFFSGVNVITYSWDGATVLTRTSSNGTRLMLTNCDYLAFAYYKKNPTNDFNFVPTSAADQIKLVSVSWRCSRSILGSKLNTESVQTAEVVMRN